MSVALYPGTFDPVTNGHLDLLRRALEIFDRIVVAIGTNPQKRPLFSAEERMEMIRESTEDLGNVEVDLYDGLLVHYAKRREILTVIRSLRTTGEFETELAFASANRLLLPNLESIYLLPSPEYAHLSSTVVREISQFGGDLSSFVPRHVEDRLQKKFT